MTAIAAKRAIIATSGPFRAMCLLLVAAFVLGGGARGDIASLVVLRPLAALILGYGLSRLELSHIRANRFVCAMALAIIALPVLHLLPLPPGWWGSLPGRDLVTEIDRAAGLGAVWRPLSLAPDGTLNALESLLVPLAALVLGIQLDSRERESLLVVVLVLGGFSALLGLAQIIDGKNLSLYFYKVTNDGKAVGLFANRNHQALLLAAMLPMLAAWVEANGSSAGRSREAGQRAAAARMLSLLAGMALLPLIMITGSRAGLLLALVALAGIALLMRRGDLSFRPGPGRTEGHTDGRTGARSAALKAKAGPAARARAMLPIALGLASLSLVALTVWLGRAAAWQRLFASAPGEDMRFLVVPTGWTMIRAYFPLGTGMGSFERAYQVHEPDSLLDPSYMNHAHGDWLELIVTGGMPALALLIVAIIGFALRTRQVAARRLDRSGDARLARLGLLVILLAALASLGDYPLRVPSLACLFVVAAVWACCPLPKNQPDEVTS